MESEVAYHLHGGYGLFCIEGSRSMHFEPAGTSAAPEEDASLQGLTRFCQHMAANLENWRGSPYQSCCPMCSFMLGPTHPRTDIHTVGQSTASACML